MAKRKPLPLFFVGLSILYFIYVVSMGNTQIIGGETIGDPGGMKLPLFLSIFMFGASIYLFITDTAKEAQKKMGKAELGLFILTLVSLVAYILLIRALGFILCTSALLFCLCFANSQGGLRREDIKSGSLWLLVTLIFQVGFYSLGRYITRSLFMASRSGTVPAWMGNTGFTAFVTAFVLAGIFAALIFILRKPMSVAKAGAAVHNAWVSAMVAVISTQTLFLVFRQLFLVRLPQGLIFW